MDSTLTDRTFWRDYWSSKEFCVPIGPKYLFHKLFRDLCQEGAVRNSIEIGGFPGYFSVFLAKYCDVDTTLLDFYIDREKIEQLCDANDLAAERLKTIEADFLAFDSDRQYDLVFSCGLIEHFENYDELIAKHIELVAPGGKLLIEIPNLRGLNGWIQKRYDPENLAIHNLKCMDLDKLVQAASGQGLTDLDVRYHGRYGVWLERLDERPKNIQRQFKWINRICRRVSKLYPAQSRSFSPYIVMTAEKPAASAGKEETRRRVA